MTLTLKGHDYKYAVEQIMLTMYPNELPEYSPSEASPLSADVTLTFCDTFASASTYISSEKGVFKGSARVLRAKLTDKLESDRLLQKIIKLSFYKAAVLETGKKPVWGALTGIRPGKIATKLLESGVSEHKITKILQDDYFVSPERGALCLDTAKAGLAVKKTLAPRDIALYVGIPFCPTRCHYCSFVSHSVEKSMKLIAPFLDALMIEIDCLSRLARGLELNILSVYIGGGTPTTLSAGELTLLMKKLASSFNLSRLREYTVEAGRPDTITKEKLDVIRAHGATRVSINPQTMSDAVLRAIGRRHTAEDVLAAVDLARRAGFPVINMDLIAGLPDDTVEGFASTLEKVLALRPENITVHTLSRKKGTRVMLDGPALPSGDEVAVMLDAAEKSLRGEGYVPYYLYRQKFMSGGFENVGWSRPGAENLYNILIMEELSTILSLGGGGVTKLVGPRSGKIERIFNPKYPYEYIDCLDSILSKKSRIKEFYDLGVIYDI